MPEPLAPSPGESLPPTLNPAEAAPEPDAPQGEYLPPAAVENSAPKPLAAPCLSSGELLSPAGSPEAAFAAFHYGADAIYLGLSKFSARADAENFSLDDVSEVTAFAHAQERPRRVLVTVNTLVLQHELGDLVEMLGALDEIGVDALILQDLGVQHIVRKHFPKFELHASTQLAVHNRAGAESLRELGFRRVILARELTLEEIREIAATSGLETEVFIHGALCYGYSGLCLLSSQVTGRSGNRGRCTYACRDKFSIAGAPETLRDGSPTRRDPRQGFAFSMKDLALPDHLLSLREAGVACFKIEGRKKSPLYVATTTSFYRRILDGKLAAAARAAHEADMKTVFSRPWTRLFIQSHRDKEVADRDTVGHRGNPIGVVEAVGAPHAGPAWLRLKTAQALECHDGLQIDVPGLGRPFGFAVETIRIVEPHPGFSPKDRERGAAQRREVFEAPAGTTLEVPLPPEHPELPLGAPVYCASSQSVKRRYKHERPKAGLYRCRRAVHLAVKLTPQELCVTGRVPLQESSEEFLEARAALPGPFSPAKDVAKMVLALRGAFEKLGETHLALGHFKFENPDGCFVPVSQLNQMRRTLTEDLERKINAARAARIARIKAEVLSPSAQPSPAKEREWALKVDRVAHLDAFEPEDWRGVREVVIDIGRDSFEALAERLPLLEKSLGREALQLALPLLTRKWEERGLTRKLERLRAAGWENWQAANVSAWTFLAAPLSGKGPGAGPGSPELALTTDWPLYVLNRAAALQMLDLGARRFTLSPEDGLLNMQKLLAEFGGVATVIVHQDTPLMQGESCAYANLIGGCPGKANCRFEEMQLGNNFGEKLTALDYHCRTIVLNQNVFCLAPHLERLAHAGARRFRADFIYRRYEPAEARTRWRLIRAGKNVPGGQAANFERGIQ